MNGKRDEMLELWNKTNRIIINQCCDLFCCVLLLFLLLYIVVFQFVCFPALHLLRGGCWERPGPCFAPAFSESLLKVLLWAASASPRPCSFWLVLLYFVAIISFSFFVRSPFGMPCFPLSWFPRVSHLILLLDWSWPAFFLLVASLAWFCRFSYRFFVTLLIWFVEGF